ncbi:hypothetical protein BZG36_05724 [Bifiguratus adelaidae]|uniref:Homeobox domain-containing protein n=1 Tax=Bifiguratus adelaidae TaxID=1938954 RepID=A0A261XT47_9FUNG|nr:hypothetical protein BZG36_05724 [Bifiguratus adelaidae]
MPETYRTPETASRTASPQTESSNDEPSPNSNDTGDVSATDGNGTGNETSRKVKKKGASGGIANSTDKPSNAPPQKAKRKRITPEQLQDLVALFEQTDTPSFEVRESLAKKLGMTNREIQVWFQNRRAKANRAKANEQNAAHAHPHHRFLHHHPGTPGNMAPMPVPGAPPGPTTSSGGIPQMAGSNSHLQFIPVFGNGGQGMAQPVGFSSKRAASRRTSAYPALQSSAPGASHPPPLLSSGGPAGQQQRGSGKHMYVPPPIKITPYQGQSQPPYTASLMQQPDYYPPQQGGHLAQSSANPYPSYESRRREGSPMSPTSPERRHHSMSSSQYGSYLNQAQGGTPFYSPTRDFFNLDLNGTRERNGSNSFGQESKGYPSYHRNPPYRHTIHTSLPPTPQHEMPPKSAIDLLASAAEYVQSEEKREQANEERRRRETMKNGNYPAPQNTSPPTPNLTPTTPTSNSGYPPVSQASIRSSETTSSPPSPLVASSSSRPRSQTTSGIHLNNVAGGGISKQNYPSHLRRGSIGSGREMRRKSLGAMSVLGQTVTEELKAVVSKTEIKEEQGMDVDDEKEPPKDSATAASIRTPQKRSSGDMEQHVDGIEKESRELHQSPGAMEVDEGIKAEAPDSKRERSGSWRPWL